MTRKGRLLVLLSLMGMLMSTACSTPIDNSKDSINQTTVAEHENMEETDEEIDLMYGTDTRTNNKQYADLESLLQTLKRETEQTNGK